MASAKVDRSRAIALLNAAFPTVSLSVGNQVKAEAEAFAARAESLVPVRSGNYKRSIRVIAGADALTWTVVAGGELTTKKVRAGVRGDDFRAAVQAVARTGAPVHKGEYDYSRAVEFKQDPVIFPLYRATRGAMRRRVAAAGGKSIKQLNLDLNRG